MDNHECKEKKKNKCFGMAIKYVKKEKRNAYEN